MLEISSDDGSVNTHSSDSSEHKDTQNRQQSVSESTALEPLEETIQDKGVQQETGTPPKSTGHSRMPNSSSASKLDTLLKASDSTISLRSVNNSNSSRKKQRRKNK